jgi:hypothetical protein
MGRHKKQKLACIARYRVSHTWMRDTVLDLRAPALNSATWQTDRATIDTLRRNATEILDGLLVSPRQGAQAC